MATSTYITEKKPNLSAYRKNILYLKKNALNHRQFKKFISLKMIRLRKVKNRKKIIP